jgi:hypothetical protein
VRTCYASNPMRWHRPGSRLCVLAPHGCHPSESADSQVTHRLKVRSPPPQLRRWPSVHSTPNHLRPGVQLHTSRRRRRRRQQQPCHILRPQEKQATTARGSNNACRCPWGLAAIGITTRAAHRPQLSTEPPPGPDTEWHCRRRRRRRLISATPVGAVHVHLPMLDDRKPLHPRPGRLQHLTNLPSVTRRPTRGRSVEQRCVQRLPCAGGWAWRSV